MIKRSERRAWAGGELIYSLAKVTRQKGPPTESSFLKKAAYKSTVRHHSISMGLGEKVPLL